MFTDSASPILIIQVMIAIQILFVNQVTSPTRPLIYSHRIFGVSRLSRISISVFMMPSVVLVKSGLAVIAARE
jgi:hypothetical protein